MKLIFCIQIRLKACYKLIAWFWWWWSSIPKISKKACLQCLYKISKKKLEMKLAFCMQINLKVSSKLISTLSRQSFAQDDTIIIDRNYEIFSNICNILEISQNRSLGRNSFSFFRFYYSSFYKLVFSFLLEVARYVQITQNRKIGITQNCPNYPKLPKIGNHNILRKECRNCFCILLWCKTFKYVTGVHSCSLVFVLHTFSVNCFTQNFSKVFEHDKVREISKF